MRLIDADKLIEGLNKKYDGYMHEESESPIEFQWMIEDEPTIKAIPIEVLYKIRDDIKEDYTMWEGTEFGDGIEYCWSIVCKHWKEQE